MDQGLHLNRSPFYNSHLQASSILGQYASKSLCSKTKVLQLVNLFSVPWGGPQYTILFSQAVAGERERTSSVKPLVQFTTEKRICSLGTPLPSPTTSYTQSTFGLSLKQLKAASLQSSIHCPHLNGTSKIRIQSSPPKPFGESLKFVLQGFN